MGKGMMKGTVGKWICREGTVERDEGRGLWENGYAGRGLWGKG